MKEFDHYLALDWAQSNMAIAHATKHSDAIDTMDVRSDMKALKAYLRSLRGKKIITFEESSPAQWIYTELIEEVDEIIVCEPYSNHLLKTGAKNDRVDAIKLLKLLKFGMLKSVFHCSDEFINVRKLVSGHVDLVHAVVRAKNQLKALRRAKGLKKSESLTQKEDVFVADKLSRLIELQEQMRREYEAEFKIILSRNQMVKNLTSIPGVGVIGAVRIAATVVDPRRFKKKTGFWLYCGLQKHELISGGRSYGKRSPRYSRRLKCVFKTAALSCTRQENNLATYFKEMIKAGVVEHEARHNLARRIAALALGVMKTGKELNLDKYNKAC